MKTLRTTYILIGIFFTGLLVLWWLDFAGIPTERGRRQRLNRVLPEMIDTSESSIHRVEIERASERLVFERRGKGDWQMKSPVDVAADPNALESLVRNLKDLRRSPDSGTIKGTGEPYGFASPVATVRLWQASRKVDSKEEQPVAALEIGKSVRDLAYVRPLGTAGIEVVDARLVAGIERPVADWRERRLMPVPTFQVSRLSVHRLGVEILADRGDGGVWRLRRPVRVIADGPKIERTLVALTSLRIDTVKEGFAADDVSDYAPFGLDHPEATVELETVVNPGKPLVLMVGKQVPGQKDLVYVRRSDQDDVAIVDSTFLNEIPRDRTGFRGKLVTDFQPVSVSKLDIQALGTTFALRREGSTWRLGEALSEKADPTLVRAFLTQLQALQTSEFLDPDKVVEPQVDPPLLSIKVWQAGLDSNSPAVSLQIGRHDILRKTLFARLEGDEVILALPDKFLEVLPKNRFAYRDLTLLEIDPGTIERLTVKYDGTITRLEPDRAAVAANQWRMVSPVEAPADLRAVTQALQILANLHAEEFVTDTSADLKRFGLDQPTLVVSWEVTSAESRSTAETRDRPTRSGGGRLVVGRPVPGKSSHYAMLEGQTAIFTLPGSILEPFVTEFHETLVLAFPTESVRRLTLDVPGRTVSFARQGKLTGGPTDWKPETASDSMGIDLSRFGDLVKQISQLRTTRFLQYKGEIPEPTGLRHPRLSLRIDLGDGAPPRILRIGNPTGDGRTLAATGTLSAGPIFLLPSMAWDALIESIILGQQLPPDPFAPPDHPAQ